MFNKHDIDYMKITFRSQQKNEIQYFKITLLISSSTFPFSLFDSLKHNKMVVC